MPGEPRRTRPQHELTVQRTEWLGPHLVRVVLTGPSLAGFDHNGHTDAYVKLLFPDPDPTSDRPVRRTYTVRRVDREARELAIDFVTHGDSGIAAPWAAAAEPGDQLVLSGPGGAYTPDPGAGWHLFAGDLSAVPAIAAAAEALPDQARGVVLVEVGDPIDLLSLETKAALDVRWLTNRDPDDAGFLARAIDGLDWTAFAEDVQVFAHGERESIKAVRRVLRERAVPAGAISISGYWARGRTEDAFQAEKRTPIGQID